MSKKIIQLNEGVIKTELKELVRTNVEGVRFRLFFARFQMIEREGLPCCER